LREGSSCVLISYGAMVQRCLEAATALDAEGVGCTVLDLRSLVPLDVEAIADTVRSTGRVVVVHEAPMTLGMGAEIVARIVEEAFDHLEAPVLRVTGPDVPYPPASLEHIYLPSVERSPRPSGRSWPTIAERSSSCRISARGSRRPSSPRGSSPRVTRSV
jgi:pyruvate dehydrogenase E1 component beta subunit